MKQNALQRILGTRWVFVVLLTLTLLGAVTIGVSIIVQFALGGWAYLIVYGSCMLGFAAAASYLIRRDLRKRSTGDPARYCQSCGYDLTGNTSGVCPECGAEARSGNAGTSRKQEAN